MQVVFNPLSRFSSLLVPEGTLPFLSLLSCFVLNVDGLRSAPFVFLAEHGRNEVCSFRVEDSECVDSLVGLWWLCLSRVTLTK